MLWWVEVKANDSSGFGFKVRVVTGHVPRQAMWLDSGCPLQAVHAILADVQLARQSAD
jgi:hypothetical protein